MLCFALMVHAVIVIISKQLTSKRLISPTHAVTLLTLLSHTPAVVAVIIIIIRNLYSAIMPLGGYRGAGGTGR